MRPLSSALLVGLFGLLFLGACSGPPTLRSQTFSESPSIDGQLSEWGGGLTRLGDKPVSMGVVPTDSLLYVAVVMSDRALIRSVAERGFILWVDPTGKQRHTYGVQYPIALQRQRASQKESEDSGPGGAERAPTLAQLFPSDLALIRNDTIRRRMPARLSSALQAQATMNTGSLIYEIAIPLNESGSDRTTDRWKHGLRTSLGSTLTIGLETPETGEESNLQPQTEGIPSVTGRGRRGRTPRGRRRGERQGGENSPSVQSPDQPALKLWTKVTVSNRK